MTEPMEAHHEHFDSVDFPPNSANLHASSYASSDEVPCTSIFLPTSDSTVQTTTSSFLPTSGSGGHSAANFLPSSAGQSGSLYPPSSNYAPASSSQPPLHGDDGSDFTDYTSHHQLIPASGFPPPPPPPSSPLHHGEAEFPASHAPPEYTPAKHHPVPAPQPHQPAGFKVSLQDLDHMDLIPLAGSGKLF